MKSRRTPRWKELAKAAMNGPEPESVAEASATVVVDAAPPSEGLEGPSPLVQAITQYEGPPQTGSIDHRRWRLAAERPGTPPTNPWIETKCHNCLGKMWTRDPTSTWEKAGVCEECQYILVSELHDGSRRQYARQARTIHNPFARRE